MPMYRQFVNLIMHDQRSTLYSMRRLGIIPHLFHEPPAAEAQFATANKGCLSTIASCNRLPKSDINFWLPPKIADVTPMHFFSLLRGQGDGCVMFTAPYGQITLYDAAMQRVIPMPVPNFSMPSNSISLSMTHGCQDDYKLYVMGKAKGGAARLNVNGSFQVFNYCRAGLDAGESGWWCWEALPPPPRVEDLLPSSRMCPSAAAVVDERTICMSSIDGGAYTFDTVKRKWRHVGSWVLPVHGAAEYVPQLGLWFGLEATGGSPHHRLCAFDLSSSWPPVVLHAWDYLDDGLVGDFFPQKRHLVNLGWGRFCIATSFSKDDKHTTLTSGFSSDEEQVEFEYNEATLLTGVDVVRCGSGALEMIKHKSQLYDIEGMNIHCVL